MLKTMLPNNQMSEYVTEVNRLFARQPENDMFPMANAYTSTSIQSPFQTANRSSSSADSTSPESFPELTYFGRPAYDPSLRPILETPRPTNQDFPRRRPIVGRKILGIPSSDSAIGSPKKEDDFYTSWQNDDSVIFPHTPPTRRTFVEHKNSHVYELFPEKVPEITPQKANLSPIMSNYSPTSSNLSNPSPMLSVSPSASIPQMSTPTFNRYASPTYTTPVYNSRNYHAMSSCSSVDGNQQKLCSFCRKNGETPLVYLTHSVKEKVGNKHIVTCPILRSHVCSICGASGDTAHTITYCPILRSSNNGAPLRSTTITLKNTRLKSNAIAMENTNSE